MVRPSPVRAELVERKRKEKHLLNNEWVLFMYLHYILQFECVVILTKSYGIIENLTTINCKEVRYSVNLYILRGKEIIIGVERKLGGAKNMGSSTQRTFTAKEFASLVNRDVRTLYMWSREGKLVPNKDFSGRYSYSTDDYKLVTGKDYVEMQESGVSEEYIV